MEEKEEEISEFEKILGLNKLGSLFLGVDKYEKALIFLTKAMENYLNKKETKEIPNFFYSNLYCNLAKAYSCLKRFDEASGYYIECIINHQILKIISQEEEMFEKEFQLNINSLISNIKTYICQNDLNLEIIKNKINILLHYFESDSKSSILVKERVLDKFKSNMMNSLSSFVDSLVNYAVILQYKYKESLIAFDMYYLAILLEPNNNVANINLNNFLREINLKSKSDEYILKRINFDCQVESKKEEMYHINAKKEILDSENKKNITFVCMKWGSKYGSDWVNKLYKGITNNSNRQIEFVCITDNSEGLDINICSLPLESEFKGWMKKSILFSDLYMSKLKSEYVCFIDLDMIVYNNIDFLFDYRGNFCLMSTDDISCENSKGGYNSSIIIWKKNFGKEIYSFMKLYEKEINKQIIRFDHYLEFVVKDADFIQDEFKGKILDYNFYCKGRDILPESGAIVAFPRSPKPSEVQDKWIQQFWN